MRPLVLVTPNTRTIPSVPDADYAGVDAGYLKLLEAGILPVFACGDFDSMTGPVPDTCEILRYPVEKDEPDSQLAVEAGISRGYQTIILTGALSGRIDHTIACLRMMCFQYPQLILMDEGQLCRLLLPGTWTVTGKYRHVSLFAVEPSRISLKGMKYPLEDRDVVPADIYTLSNAVSKDTASVTVHQGLMLLVESDLP